jgi:NAD(P)-dependent dehydrogenase (short-subunit alcohol dehydrogenase family)
MSIRFDEKVAVITGAGSGLGKSYALYLASCGARVIVNDIGVSNDKNGDNYQTAHLTAEEIKSHGGRAEANFESVDDPAGARRLVEAALDNFGSVDILINNAGILRDKTFLKMSLEEFDRVLSVHLLGTVYVTRAAFPVMRENSYGRIVLTTSIAGLYGNFGQTNYSAAKMAIVGFMNALKLEGKKYNILINTVAPLAATPLALSIGIFPKHITSLLKPELVTPLVAFLCSDACKSSGEAFSAGGGYFAKAQMVEGPGARFDPNNEITPEMVAENFDAISNMNGAVAFESAMHELQHVIGPLLGESESGEK